jgi:O-acetyl-ADP-ribose deacetylase (regulator of RNase III)
MKREVLLEQTTAAGWTIRIVHGNLTVEPVDAIVNAANEHLQHGAGVAGAIVDKGGWIIQEESDRWVREHGPVRTGTAAITGAGVLPCCHVIHAVGPVWQGGQNDEEVLLASAVRSALIMAAEYRLASVSIPAISSGIFGFPKDRCAEIMLRTVRDYLAAHLDGSLREVNLCNIDDKTCRIFLAEARRTENTIAG